MPIRVTVGLLMAALSLSPPAAAGQQPVEIAFADPQPHFVAAWAPEKEREAEHSAALARRVTLELQDVSLDAALKALTNRAGLRITYSQAILPKGKRVTIKAGDIAVVTALTEMLFRSGLDVVVDQDGTLALVRCKHVTPRTVVQDSGTIVGRVTDKATGSPLVGATVVLEGNKWSATTDNEGRYRMTGVEPGTYTVRARYIGYALLSTTVTVGAEAEVTADFGLEKSVQRLEDVVTTGTIIPTEVKALPTPVTVITDSEIQQQNIRGVQQLLRQAVPTAVSWDEAPYPNQTSISVRGASTIATGGEQMKVFVDGIQTATLFASAVDPASIERVEVIRGPQASTIYGPDALNGVIQIFTKRGSPTATRPQVDVQAELGAVKTPYTGFNNVLRQQYSGSVNGGSTEFGYNFGGGLTHVDDYIPLGEESAQSNRSIYGGMHYSHGMMSADVSGRYFDWLVGQVINPPLFEAGFVPFSKPFNQPLDYLSQTVGARLGFVPTTWFQANLTLGSDRLTVNGVQSRARLTTPADTLLAVVNTARQRTSETFTASVQGSLSRQFAGSFTAGVDHYSYSATGWSTTGALKTFGNIVTDPGDPVSANLSDTHDTGEFAQVQIGFVDALFLTGGVRLEQNTDFGDSVGTSASPRFGASYVRPVGAATIKLRASYGSAIRPPDPVRKLGIVRPTQVILANPNLGPERQFGADFGIDVVFGAASLGVTYYNQVAKQLIDFVPIPGGSQPTFQSQNVGRVHNTGVELEGSILVGPVQIRANYGYARAKVEELAPGYTGDQRVGDQVFITPRHTVGASVTAQPFGGTTVTGGFTYVGSWDNYDYISEFRCLGSLDAGGTNSCPSDFLATGSTRSFIISYPGFVRLRVSVSQQITPPLGAFLTVDNLTNNYAYEQDNLEFPQFGRISSVGLRLHY